jgi:hypothetical protein
MPVATDIFTRIEDLADYWVAALDDNIEELGFKFVGAYDDPLTVYYPAVQVSTGATSKTVHATHMFLVQWTLDFYVMHAEATESHRVRSKEMLALVTSLVNFLESDKEIQNRIIFGYVINERAGVIRPQMKPSAFVVSTLLTYQATAEVPF